MIDYDRNTVQKLLNKVGMDGKYDYPLRDVMGGISTQKNCLKLSGTERVPYPP